MTTAFITADEVKAYLPVRSGNYDYDDRIDTLILTASKQIEAATRRSFDRQEHTQTFDTFDTHRQVYDFAGVANSSGVKSRTRPQSFTLRGFAIATDPAPVVRYDPARAFGDDTILSPADYFLDHETSRLTLDAPTGRHMGALRVTYTAGYAIGAEGTLSAALPADLKLACTVQTINLFNRAQPDAVGVDSSRGEGKSGSAGWSSELGLSPEVIGMVRHYKALFTGRG